MAHVWYTVAAADRRLGLLGHVYTRPDHRRRGLSAQLVQAAMADFLVRGGRVMQLFTSTPYTVRFYEQLGYENVYSNQVYHETDWTMRYPVGSQNTFGELIDACLSRRDELGIEIVYAMCVDRQKQRLFRELGFRQKALLPGHYKIAGRRYDGTLYEV